MMNRLSWSAFVMFLHGAVLCLSAAAPPNDDFANRLPLSGFPLSVSASNVDAGKQTGEPAHAGVAGGRSVWWTWSAPADGELTVHTDGSAIDTLLAVYRGSDLSSLTELAANDDHGVQVTSRVRFEVQQNTICQIAVDGFDPTADVGELRLNLSFLPAPVVRPSNDLFRNRSIVSTLPASFQLSNLNATRESGEPLHAGREGDVSLWWTWTATATAPVSLTTEGSELDTLLAVYRGTDLAKLIPVASSDDVDPENGQLFSRVIYEARAGETYQVALDGYDGVMGLIRLQMERLPFRLLTPSRHASGDVELNLVAVPGVTNEVQWSADCQTWRTVVAVVPTNSELRVVDNAGTSVARFYRARLFP